MKLEGSTVVICKKMTACSVNCPIADDFAQAGGEYGADGRGGDTDR